jgi:hypothetical protein
MHLRDTKRTENLIIIGGGPSRAQVPFADPEFDRWVVGVSAPEFHGYSDVVFEMHSGILSKEFGLWKNNSSGKYNYIADLNDCGKPICMCEHTDKIPKSFPFPIDEVTGAFGKYFNNTVSYMIAAGIMLGYKKMYFYGVDMDEEKYVYQRPICEFYIGYAIGAGIEVFIPDSSSLLKSRDLYGYTNRLYGYDLNALDNEISKTNKAGKVYV